MKQIVRISFLLVAAAALTLSCSKEMGSPVPGSIVSEEPFQITVSIPNDMTKVTFTQENKGEEGDKVKISWDSSDELVIIDNGDAAVSRVFSIVPASIANEGKTATFELKAGEEAMFTPSNGKYSILYGAASMEAALNTDYSSQTQTGNASLEDLNGKYIALVEGVNTLEDVNLTNAWATSHGGSFKQTGILRLWLQMPDEITSVASVIINAPSAIFYKSNALSANEKVSSLKLSFTGNASPATEGGKKTVTGYLMIPWQDVNITANTSLSVIVTTAAGGFYAKPFTVESGKAFLTGSVNAIKLSKTDLDVVSGDFAGGSGTSADPWLIANATHMGNIASYLSTSEKKYFKLIDDITLGDTWTSLNPTPFTRQIDFDGNGRTINHLRNPLFDDLNGSVYNLTIDDAVVSSTNTVGILANTVKTAASQVSGVTLSDCSLNFSPSATGSFVGGLVGEVSTGSSFDDCHLNNVDIDLKVAKESYLGGAFGYVHHADATIGHTLKCTVDNNSSVKSGNYAAGFISKFDGGRVEKAEVACDVSGSATVGGLIAHMTSGTLSGITVSGKVSGTQRVGGLIGNNAGGTIENSCYIDNTVSGTLYRVGGLIGWASGTNDLEVSNCYTRGSISAPQQLSGMLGGADGSGKIEITNCYTDSSLSDGSYRGALVARTWNTDTTVSGFIAWVTGIGISGSGAVPGTAGTDYYIGQDGTILSHAQTFGWNFTIWNEVNPPTLK